MHKEGRDTSWAVTFRPVRGGGVSIPGQSMGGFVVKKVALWPVVL